MQEVWFTKFNTEIQNQAGSIHAKAGCHMSMFHDKCGTLLRRREANGIATFYCPKCNIDIDMKSTGDENKIVFKGERKKVFIYSGKDVEERNWTKEKDKGSSNEVSKDKQKST